MFMVMNVSCRPPQIAPRGRLPFNADGKRVPLDVKPGDHIPFGKYTSQEVKLDGEATT
jgi:co-chaperonin GroES (HSP10)